MKLTASSWCVSSCPKTDLIAEVAEDIFCLNCSSHNKIKKLVNKNSAWTFLCINRWEERDITSSEEICCQCEKNNAEEEKEKEPSNCPTNIKCTKNSKRTVYNFIYIG